MYNYWCKNRGHKDKCDFCDSNGNISLEKKRIWFCFDTGKTRLKLMGETAFNINVGEFKKGRPKQEAKKRSSDNFKKEILPALSKQDKRYFSKKYGYRS